MKGKKTTCILQKKRKKSAYELEEWKILWSTLRIVPINLEDYDYDLFSVAKFMVNSIKETRDLNQTKTKVIQAFFPESTCQ